MALLFKKNILQFFISFQEKNSIKRIHYKMYIYIIFNILILYRNIFWFYLNPLGGPLHQDLPYSRRNGFFRLTTVLGVHPSISAISLFPIGFAPKMTKECRAMKRSLLGRDATMLYRSLSFSRSKNASSIPSPHSMKSANVFLQ